MSPFLTGILDFMDRGGSVVWAILVLTIVLVWLIAERFWFFYREFKNLLSIHKKTWEKQTDQHSWFAEQIRRQLISELDCQMQVNLKIIPMLIALLPMFGLLGTVTGMIQVFDVMASMGSGNARAMANGVSAATIPTMAGMVIALVALPFAARLDRTYKGLQRRVSKHIQPAS